MTPPGSSGFNAPGRHSSITDYANSHDTERDEYFLDSYNQKNGKCLDTCSDERSEARHGVAFSGIDNVVRDLQFRHRHNLQLMELMGEEAICISNDHRKVYLEVRTILDWQQRLLDDAVELQSEIDGLLDERGHFKKSPRSDVIEDFCDSIAEIRNDFDAKHFTLCILRGRFPMQLEALLKKASSVDHTEWDFVKHETLPAIGRNLMDPDASSFHYRPASKASSTSIEWEQLEYYSSFLELAREQPLVGKMPSRRVIIENLPSRVTQAQLLRGVRAYGGIISASILDTFSFYDNNAKAAMIEFVYPGSAADYVKFIASHGTLYFTDEKGVDRVAEASIIPTRSFGYASIDRQSLENGQTRAITLRKFPIQSVWYFLLSMGIYDIVRVEYEETTGTLDVEFATLHRADHVMRLVRRKSFQPYQPEHGLDVPEPMSSFRKDSSQGKISELMGDNGSTIRIPYINPNFLEREWNRIPFNKDWPTRRSDPAMSLQGLQPRHIVKPNLKSPLNPPIEPLRPRTREEIIAEQHDIDLDDVSDFLERGRNHKDQAYRILGSNITLIRHQCGWSISADGDTKLLMATTLHHPDWTQFWDDYFSRMKQINLRKWELYGMVVKHRQDLAAIQGYEAWEVVPCEKCEWGCCEMRKAAVAEAVGRFLGADLQTAMAMLKGTEATKGL